MSKRECTKKPYETREDARRAIKRMAERFGSVVYKRAYRCAKCRAWHVSSTPPPRGRRIQR